MAVDGDVVPDDARLGRSPAEDAVFVAAKMFAQFDVIAEILTAKSTADVATQSPRFPTVMDGFHVSDGGRGGMSYAKGDKTNNYSVHNKFIT